MQIVCLTDEIIITAACGVASFNMFVLVVVTRNKLKALKYAVHFGDAACWQFITNTKIFADKQKRNKLISY